MPSLTKRSAALLATAAVVITASATTATAMNRTSTAPAGTVAAASSSSVATARKDTIGGPKKGAPVWKQKGITASLKDSGVSWYYDWAATPNGVKAPRGVDFVPMIWGPGSVSQANLDAARKNGKTLLGFNEPDLPHQSNMTVEQALDLWPRLESTRMRLGAPAVASGADKDNEWLGRFMKGAKKRGYRVDFIPLHWYSSDFNTPAAVQQLKDYIHAVHAKYPKMPIWVTEYAMRNFRADPKYPSAARQASFVKSSTTMLNHISYVEHYAWFAFPTAPSGLDETGLYRPGGAITKMGKAYRAAR